MIGLVLLGVSFIMLRISNPPRDGFCVCVHVVISYVNISSTGAFSMGIMNDGVKAATSGKYSISSGLATDVPIILPGTPPTLQPGQTFTVGTFLRGAVTSGATYTVTVSVVSGDKGGYGTSLNVVASP